MKALILILFLICQVGIGQDLSPEFKVWQDSIKREIRILEQELDTIHTINIILQQWKTYQQERWNDSVYKMYYSRISPGNFAVHYPDTLIREYSRRKPTLEGFMEYLERRIKR